MLNEPSAHPAPTGDRWRKLAIIAGAFALLVLFVLIGIMYVDRSKPKSSRNATKSTQIIEKVGSIYLLPSGEDPTVAEIKDVTKLNKQPFYKDAQNGDYLLVYKNAKLALIYREKDHQLINVAPIAADPSPSQPETR